MTSDLKLAIAIVLGVSALCAAVLLTHSSYTTPGDATHDNY